MIFTCGATIEWLKNELELFNDGRDTEAMAMALDDNQGVYLIPAFSGLGDKVLVGTFSCLFIWFMEIDHSLLIDNN